jgi:arginyl-tRNA synthetase
VALWRQDEQLGVFQGFDETYGKLGVAFDKLYYESDTYLLGKDIVEDGLAKGVFFRKEDGSVWVDLTEAGYDQKVVLRADGTSVYITQDLGTARMRYHDFGCEQMVYVVADEQNYHFAVLFEVLKRRLKRALCRRIASPVVRIGGIADRPHENPGRDGCRCRRPDGRSHCHCPPAGVRTRRPG